MNRFWRFVDLNRGDASREYFVALLVALLLLAGSLISEIFDV